MKKALVLAGGGTKGAYQDGIITALREIGHDDWNIVTGTSVGALNAALVVQKDYDKLTELYNTLTADMIVDGYVPNDMSLVHLFKDRKEFLPAFKQYLKEKGINIRPFYETVDAFYDEKKFFESEIDFGCITATASHYDPVYVTKDMMKEHGKDWLVASASAYPAFPVKEIDGKEYVDGGYFDNLPIDFALRLGAEEVLAIDLKPEPCHPQYIGREHIHYIFPKAELYNFLDFDKDKLNMAKVLGYNDAKKAFGIYEGWKYTFEPFEIPAFFDKWYLETMKLETRIKLANKLNNQFRSETYVTDELKERMHRPFLRTKDYFFGMMDAIMDICACREEKVNNLEEVMKLILVMFAKCADEDYELYPSLGIETITSYARTLDTLGIVSKLVHCNLYPNHSFLSENIILTVYPFEQSMADFITCMMKSLSNK